jgi:hypothetical protein
MRKKDSMLLEDCYNKVQHPILKEAVDNMEFSMEIDVEYIESNEIDRKILQELDVKGDKVTLKYRIDIEYRSWGIKSIYPLGMKLAPFALTKMDEEFEEKTVKTFDVVDLSGVQYEGGLDGDSFSPESIVLYLDKDLNIVAEKCKVTF